MAPHRKTKSATQPARVSSPAQLPRRMLGHVPPSDRRERTDKYSHSLLPQPLFFPPSSAFLLQTLIAQYILSIIPAISTPVVHTLQRFTHN
jgi:hypothetical protein